MEREKLKSRLGFILISAGCAIGIGNVWKFAYMAGQGGGGFFVLLYLLFLVMLGIPIMSMEFAVGRASQKSPAQAYKALEKAGQKWHIHGYIALIGNYLLMMFYTTVAGWMLYYFYLTSTGKFVGLNTDGVANVFSEMLQKPVTMTICMLIIVVVGFFICSIGLQNGLEKVTKVMMVALLAIMVILAINSFFMKGAKEGLSFYLIPSIERAKAAGIGNTAVGAMNQAFFTLSIGIGAMAIFGSYIGKDRSLLGESVTIAALDTFVAITSGLIIFPACFSFGINPDSGPSLIFITLPNVFVSMAGGQIWGALFFLFMSFASLSTVIAVFENIIACTMELLNIERKKAVVINFIVISILSLPCALGFNVLSGIQPLGTGSTILDLEDLIVSQFLLPLGSLVYLLFCTSKYGWGFENYQKEDGTIESFLPNIGKGLKVPHWVKFYVTIILPIIVIFVFINGII